MAMYQLSEISTRAPKDLEKDDVKEATAKLLDELDELQNLLYAEAKHSILVVLQAPDAGGKDGAIRKVFGRINPQGVRVQSFKKPTEEELAHDFLWRIHQHAPQRGMIQVFNRSHYEDVLITRVHGLIDDATAHRRFKTINHFEQMLREENNTQILKFYLHISPEEQRERLEERMHIPRKMWKYNDADFKEAERWDDYRKAYEDIFEHCNKIPWTIVPSDQNWYKEHLIAAKLHETLTGLKMEYPLLPTHRL
ncbi:polyphosphate kinase [Paracnuella aquatica]|nr:polyphosphate kinase [Paracnuella aquatica]